MAVHGIEYTDTIRFGSGILPADVTLSRIIYYGTTAHLQITHNTTGDTIIVFQQFRSPPYTIGDGIDKIIFTEDGTVISAQGIVNMTADNNQPEKFKRHVRSPSNKKGWAFGQPYYARQSRWRDNRLRFIEDTAQRIAHQGGAN